MFVVVAVAKLNGHSRASERSTGNLKTHMKDGQSRQTAEAGDEASLRNHHQSPSKKKRDPKPEVKKADKRPGKRLDDDTQKDKGKAATNGNSNSKHNVEQNQPALAELKSQEKEMENLQPPNSPPKKSKKRKQKPDSEDEGDSKVKKIKEADNAGADKKTRKKRKVKDGASDEESKPKDHPLPPSQAPLRSTPSSKSPPGPHPPNGIANPSWSFASIQEANTVPQPEPDQDQDSVILPTTEAPSPELGPATTESARKMVESNFPMNGFDGAKATLYQISQLLMASDPADFGEEDEAIGHSPPWHPLDDVDVDGTKGSLEGKEMRVKSKKNGKRMRTEEAAPDGKAKGMLSDVDDHEEPAPIKDNDEAGKPNGASDEEDSTSQSISTSSSEATTPEAEAEKHSSHQAKKKVSKVGEKSLTSSANRKPMTSAEVGADRGAATNTVAHSDNETITVGPVKARDTQEGLPSLSSSKKSTKTQSTKPNDVAGDRPNGAPSIKEKKTTTMTKSQPTAEKQAVKEAISRQGASKSANSMDQEPSRSDATTTFGPDLKPQIATKQKQVKDPKGKKGKDKVPGGDENQSDRKKQKRSKEPRSQSEEATPSSRTSSPEPSPSPKKSKGRNDKDSKHKETQDQQKTQASKKPPAPSKEKTLTSTSTTTQPPSNQNDIENPKVKDLSEQEEEPEHIEQQKSLESRFDSKPDAPPSKAKKPRGPNITNTNGNEKKPGQKKQQQPKKSRVQSNQKSPPSQATSARPSSRRSNSKSSKSTEFVTASDDSDSYRNALEADHSDAKEDDERPPQKSIAPAKTKQSSVRPNHQHEGETASPEQSDDNKDKQSSPQSPPPTRTKRKYVRRKPVLDKVRGDGEAVSPEQSDDNNDKQSSTQTKRKYVRSKPVPDTVRGKGETASSEPPHKGPFQITEKAALDKFKIDYCTVHSLATSEFLALVHSNSRSNYADRAVFWNDVSESTPRRDRASVQKFCRKYWPPDDVKRGDFSAEEDELIKKLVAEKGTLWKAIAKQMGRLGDDVKDRYQNHINVGGTAGGSASKKNEKEGEDENEDDDKGEEESDDE